MASDAGPLLPVLPEAVFPAIVVMMPGPAQAAEVPERMALVELAQTMRIRKWSVSAMYRLPAPSNVMPEGRYSSASVAGMPSTTASL